MPEVDRVGDVAEELQRRRTRERRRRGGAGADHGQRAEHRHSAAQPGNGVASENASAAGEIAASPADSTAAGDGRAAAPRGQASSPPAPNSHARVGRDEVGGGGVRRPSRAASSQAQQPSSTAMPPTSARRPRAARRASTHRPQQVELLLDRQRPEVLHGRGRVLGDREVVDGVRRELPVLDVERARAHLVEELRPAGSAGRPRPSPTAQASSVTSAAGRIRRARRAQNARAATPARALDLAQQQRRDQEARDRRRRRRRRRSRRARRPATGGRRRRARRRAPAAPGSRGGSPVWRSDGGAGGASMPRRYGLAPRAPHRAFRRSTVPRTPDLWALGALVADGDVDAACPVGANRARRMRARRR